ncbi:MAG TPA: hypothetical protein VH590_03050, partial [Ktedonobacterales bacterium]
LWLRTVLVLITLAVIWLFDRWMRLKTVENEQRIRRGGGSRRQPPRRQAAPQPYRQPSSYAPMPRPTPPQAGPRPTPGTQPRPRRVSQE